MNDQSEQARLKSSLHPAPDYTGPCLRPSIRERQRAALLDRRRLDLLLHYVKELDSYSEAKKRLGTSPPQKEDDKDPEKPLQGPTG